MNTLELIKEINEIAERNAVKSKEQHVRDLRNMKPGEVWRQGDLYVWRVEDSHKVGNVVGTTETGTRQLAIGSTQGQRHCLTGGEFKIYEGRELPEGYLSDEYAGVVLGYAFDILSDEARNTHPDHNHAILSKGRYQVTHQLDLQTMTRVAD